MRKQRRTRLRGPEAIDPLEIAISEPDPFPEEVLALIQNNVQDLALIVEVEKRAIFDPRQTADFCSAWNPDRDRATAARHCSRELAEQFELVAKWFAWRKHPDLAQRYMERARVVYEILSEKEMQPHG